MKSKWLLKGLKLLVFGMWVIAVLGGGVMLLWNWLIPPLTGWHAVTFGQALGLLVLCRILFRGSRGRGGDWLLRMRERFQHMTPEENEQFREFIRYRFRRGS